MSGKTGGEAEKSEETSKGIETESDPGTMSSDQKLQLSEQYAQQLKMLKAAKSKAHSTSVKAEYGEGGVETELQDLRRRLEMTQIQNRMIELDCSQRIMEVSTQDKHHRGL